MFSRLMAMRIGFGYALIGNGRNMCRVRIADAQAAGVFNALWASSKRGHRHPFGMAIETWLQ